MIAFYVLGAVFAVWAVIVSFLGIRKHDFPSTKSAERLLIVISIVLFFAAAGSAVIAAAMEEHEGEGHPEEGEKTSFLVE
jgi:hypothetical protein